MTIGGFLFLRIIEGRVAWTANRHDIQPVFFGVAFVMVVVLCLILTVEALKRSDARQLAEMNGILNNPTRFYFFRVFCPVSFLSRSISLSVFLSPFSCPRPSKFFVGFVPLPAAYRGAFSAYTVVPAFFRRVFRKLAQWLRFSATRAFLINHWLETVLVIAVHLSPSRQIFTNAQVVPYALNPLVGLTAKHGGHRSFAVNVLMDLRGFDFSQVNSLFCHALDNRFLDQFSNHCGFDSFHVIKSHAADRRIAKHSLVNACGINFRQANAFLAREREEDLCDSGLRLGLDFGVHEVSPSRKEAASQRLESHARGEPNIGEGEFLGGEHPGKRHFIREQIGAEVSHTPHDLFEQEERRLFKQMAFLKNLEVLDARHSLDADLDDAALPGRFENVIKFFDQFGIRVNIFRMKHGELLVVGTIRRVSAIISNSLHFFCRGCFTAMGVWVRADGALARAVGSTLVASRGLGFLFGSLLFHRLDFMLCFWRILEIVIKRAQDLTVQRAAVALRALCDCFMKSIFFVGDSNGNLNHAVIVAALRRLVKGEFFLRYRRNALKGAAL